MDKDLFNGEANIGFILSDTARLLRKRMNQRMREHGATRAQWRVLAWIARQPGIHQAKLAEILEVEPISLCRAVDRMEEMGLVRRVVDPKDRRLRLLYLTEKAEPIIDDLWDVSQEFSAKLLADFSQAEVEQLRALLLRIRSCLDDLPAEPIEGRPAASKNISE
jgi:MarR family transcriptional regulator for hemolysin